MSSHLHRCSDSPALDCIKAFSETDFTEDLPKIDIPVWIAHGDDDQIVPIQAAGLKAAELIPQATLTVYPGGSHGLPGVFEQQFNADVLDFIKS